VPIAGVLLTVILGLGLHVNLSPGAPHELFPGVSGATASTGSQWRSKQFLAARRQASGRRPPVSLGDAGAGAISITSEQAA
jgi:hypothetical protein